MLKTNSKQARENIRGYIAENTLDDNEKQAADFSDAARILREKFENETRGDYTVRRYGYTPRVFTDWIQGGGGLYIGCEHNATGEILAGLLEETPEQAARFTECESIRVFAGLIYREIYK